jgi:hypothetical protein
VVLYIEDVMTSLSKESSGGGNSGEVAMLIPSIDLMGGKIVLAEFYRILSHRHDGGAGTVV